MFGKNALQRRQEMSLVSTSPPDEFRDSKDESQPPLDPLIAGFLLYAEAELGFARESLDKYASVLRQLERELGKRIGAVTREDVYRIKARFVQAKLSDNWLAST